MYTYRLSHVLRKVRNVEVGRLLVAFGLEARIEGLLWFNVSSLTSPGGLRVWYPRKTDFIAKLVKSTNTQLRITDSKVLGEAETILGIRQKGGDKMQRDTYPLQAPVEVSMIAFEVSTFPKRAA